MKGCLNLVSVGPGLAEHITSRAQACIQASEVIVGYELYLTWIEPWIGGKQIYTTPLTKERERVLSAIEFARQGKTVALVSSGDIGIYAMAGLAFEEMNEADQYEVKVIPGITAANACASLLGAPLTHDFATLSLSDLLCPWEWIEQRAQNIAAADLAVVLYNVQSQKRHSGIYRILDIMLQHKSPATVCGVVRNAYRPEQEVKVCALDDLKSREFDMLTSIVIGNRFTRRKNNWMYTPRGYNSWGSEPAPSAEKASAALHITDMRLPTRQPVPRLEASHSTATTPGCTIDTRTLGSPLPALEHSHAVWVFSGTSDGNALANSIIQAGFKVILSAKTDYGGLVAGTSCPDAVILSGQLGKDNRRRVLRTLQPLVVVDATHPHAKNMSMQLMELTADLQIPYIRYEREPSVIPSHVHLCNSASEAVRQALIAGKRIFLSTGTKELRSILELPGTSSSQWFIRLTPDPQFLQAAIESGIPRSHICAMQGPFSRTFNEMLWSEWKIDAVITKESGDAGGFRDKAEAAEALGIPMYAVARPNVPYRQVASDFPAVVEYIKTCGVER